MKSKNIRMVNEGPGIIGHFTDIEPMVTFGEGTIVPNTIYAANESRFKQNNYSEPLTAYAVGWREPMGMRANLDFLAPGVQADRLFEYTTNVNAEAFLSEADDIRAIGSAFKRVQYNNGKAIEKTYNKGLTIRVDHDQVMKSMPNFREVYTGRLMERLVRNDYRRAITLAAAASTDTAVTWATTADPDLDMIDAGIRYSDLVGYQPNRALYDQSAWSKRLRTFRGQATAGGFKGAATGAPMTPGDLAQYLGLEEVQFSRQYYVTAGATATTKSRILPTGLVLIFTARQNLSKEDDSNVKTFWTPCETGERYRVHVKEEIKYTDITVEHYSNIVVTNALGMQKLTVS